jgi:hypothetical protein
MYINVLRKLYSTVLKMEIKFNHHQFYVKKSRILLLEGNESWDGLVSGQYFLFYADGFVSFVVVKEITYQGFACLFEN